MKFSPGNYQFTVPSLQYPNARIPSIEEEILIVTWLGWSWVPLYNKCVHWKFVLCFSVCEMLPKSACILIRACCNCLVWPASSFNASLQFKVFHDFNHFICLRPLLKTEYNFGNVGLGAVHSFHHYRKCTKSTLFYMKKWWWFAIAHDNWYTCTDAGTVIIVMQSGMQQAARRHWTSSRSYTAYTNGAYVRSGTSLGHILDRMRALYRCQNTLLISKLIYSIKLIHK